LPEKTEDYCKNQIRSDRLTRDTLSTTRTYVNRWRMYEKLFKDQKFA